MCAGFLKAFNHKEVCVLLILFLIQFVKSCYLFYSFISSICHCTSNFGFCKFKKTWSWVFMFLSLFYSHFVWDYNVSCRCLCATLVSLTEMLRLRPNTLCDAAITGKNPQRSQLTYETRATLQNQQENIANL